MKTHPPEKNDEKHCNQPHYYGLYGFQFYIKDSVRMELRFYVQKSESSLFIIKRVDYIIASFLFINTAFKLINSNLYILKNMKTNSEVMLQLMYLSKMVQLLAYLEVDYR